MHRVRVRGVAIPRIRRFEVDLEVQWRHQQQQLVLRRKRLPVAQRLRRRAGLHDESAAAATAAANNVRGRQKVVERLVRVVQQRPVPIVLKPQLLQLHQLPSGEARHLVADELHELPRGPIRYVRPTGLHQLPEREDLIVWLGLFIGLLFNVFLVFFLEQSQVIIVVVLVVGQRLLHVLHGELLLRDVRRSGK
eukprot:COSAG04_NODE_1485_length_6559_cov_7.307585_3_plen_193_part_00